MDNLGSKLQSKKNLLDKLQYFDPDNSRSSQDGSISPGHHQFDSYNQYILSLIGFAAGFGSFWRFPYLVYKNGGGAFLIPYFTAIFLLGMPILYLETATGQMHQMSTPFIFARVNKGFKMLGITFLFVCFNLSGYYNLILTYSYRFIFSAFVSPLPFANETPFENKYFNKQVLNASNSIDQFGSIQPSLFILYIFSILICFIIVKNGVKQSGKIVVVTSLVPYVLFIILAIRGLFLQGAINGIKYLFIPDFSKLLKIQIWVDAAVQVFYQMTVAIGGIVNFSSLKPKKQKYLKGIYIIPLSIIICGLISGLNVFMYLGHFCQQQKVDLHKLTLSGPQLSFNIFPKALSILPFSNLWVFLFFTAMVFLGIDSQFGYIQTVYCYLKDQMQKNGNKMITFLGRDFSLQTIKILFIVAILLFCPFLTSSAGIHYLQFFDRFVATIPLSLGAVVNYIFFVKIIPLDQLERESLKYTKQQAPKWIKFLLKGKIVLFILLGNFFLACVNQFFYFFKYSFKFYIIGWIITAYPYVLAYIYYKKHRQEKNKTTFAQFKQPRMSQL